MLFFNKSIANKTLTFLYLIISNFISSLIVYSELAASLLNKFLNSLVHLLPIIIEGILIDDPDPSLSIEKLFSMFSLILSPMITNLNPAF